MKQYDWRMRPWQQAGIVFVRMSAGIFLLYHGFEIFNPEKMSGYLQWEIFSDPVYGKWLVYGGKVAELLGGLSFLLGMFMKMGAVVVMIIMAYISFFVGKGKIWYEDQHPFLFVLLAFMFFIIGPGHYSVDYLIRHKTLDKINADAKE
ncbi:MAG: DoxX family membrane protein [Terrimonas sp.]|nr:DoxX family membrane protein [Terrimonas sp.]